MGRISGRTIGMGSNLCGWAQNCNRFAAANLQQSGDWDIPRKTINGLNQGAGNRTATIDELERRTTVVYDARNQATTRIDPLGYRTTLTFDAVGNATVLIDPVGNRTTWTFDALDRAVEEYNPQNKLATVAYDAAGRASGRTDRVGRRIDYGYDTADRMTTEKWYAAGGSLSQTQTFVYDAANRLTGAADPDGAYTLTYDAANRVTNALEPFGLSLTFTYDASGNRTKVDDSKGGVTTNTYDAVGMLTKRELTGTSATLREDFGYDAAHQMTSETRYSDLAGTTKVGDTLNTFDESGRLTKRQHRNGSNTVLWTGTYTFDAADRLTAKIENATTTSYSYDAFDQVVKDGSAATVTYDANGNRTNTGYTTGTGNRTTADGTWTYTFDDAGNVTKRSKGASAETWTYVYDQDNQLVSAEQRATDGGTLQGKVEYAYDAFGNRLSRKQYNGSLTLTSEERFGYDGWDTSKPGAIGSENFDPWVDLDGSNALTARRVYGTGFDDLDAKVASGGTVNWYLTDNQGSVRNLTNSSGALVGTIVYDAFGKTTSSSGTTDRYGYTGREWDSFLGLQYSRARVYDPTIAKWYSADPLGFGAGDANLYRYVGNRATGARDPSGQYIIFNSRDTVEAWSAWLSRTDHGDGIRAVSHRIVDLGDGRYTIEFLSPDDPESALRDLDNFKRLMEKYYGPGNGDIVDQWISSMRSGGLYGDDNHFEVRDKPNSGNGVGVAIYGTSISWSAIQEAIEQHYQRLERRYAWLLRGYNGVELPTIGSKDGPGWEPDYKKRLEYIIKQLECQRGNSPVTEAERRQIEAELRILEMRRRKAAGLKPLPNVNLQWAVAFPIVAPFLAFAFIRFPGVFWWFARWNLRKTLESIVKDRPGAAIVRADPNGRWVIFEQNGIRYIMFDSRHARPLSNGPLGPGRNSPETGAAVGPDGNVLVLEGMHRLEGIQRGATIPPSSGGVPDLPGWLIYRLFP